MPKYIINPVGKPRMTRRDKWKQRPPVMRYRMFCDEARLHGIQLPENGAHVTFVLPMPKTWSKKKTRSYGRPATSVKARSGQSYKISIRRLV